MCFPSVYMFAVLNYSVVVLVSIHRTPISLGPKLNNKIINIDNILLSKPKAVQQYEVLFSVCSNAG